MIAGVNPDQSNGTVVLIELTSQNMVQSAPVVTVNATATMLTINSAGVQTNTQVGIFA
jgi:hypothetical protein